MNIKSDISSDRVSEAEAVSERDTRACLVSYLVIGAFAFPIVFLFALALGSGFFQSLVIALVLAAPVTAMTLVGMRLVFGR
ncbi:MAG: hypothetical protein JXR14_06860 [Paracoccaceae bacterium]